MPHFQSTLDSKRMTTKFHHPLKQTHHHSIYSTLYHDQDISSQPQPPQSQPSIETHHRTTTSFSKKPKLYQFNSTAPSSPTQSTSSLSTLPSPLTTISNGSIPSSSSSSGHKTIDDKSSSDPITTTTTTTNTFSKPSWSKKHFGFNTITTTTTTTPNPSHSHSNSQFTSNSKQSNHSIPTQSLSSHSHHPWFLKLEHDERHHPFDPDQVPYWLSYQPEVIDHYILMMYASSIDPFRLPSTSSNPLELPKLILDLGCGPYGTWSHGVFKRYGAQTQTHLRIIGLDLCPVQSVLPSLHSHHQSEFIQHDFLNHSLPFPDDTFDYIHSSFIASGIPEDKWSKLLEEILRVLKPGQKFELIETNLNPNLKTHEILDKHFISPFPLSIIPAQLSMLDDGNSVERRRIEFEEKMKQEAKERSHRTELEPIQTEVQKKMKKSKRSLNLNSQLNLTWNLLNHTHHLSLQVSQARADEKPSLNGSNPMGKARSESDRRSGMISHLLIERFGWKPLMDLHSFQSLKVQYQDSLKGLSLMESKLNELKMNLKMRKQRKEEMSVSMSVRGGDETNEGMESVKEWMEKIVLKRSEMKKSSQLIRNEFLNVQNRLGIEIGLGASMNGVHDSSGGGGNSNEEEMDEKSLNSKNSIRIESFLVSKN